MPIRIKGKAMNLRQLFTINVPISIFFGGTCIFLPNWLLSLYGVELSPPGEFMTQLAGAAFLAFGALAFLARSSQSKEFRLALALGLFVQDSVGTIIAAYGQVQGTFNAFGWTTVALDLLLALGYGYFRFVSVDAA
jgi:hypothetical protein